MDVNEHERLPHYTQTQIKVKEQLVASKKGYGCERARETIPHYTQTQIKVKEQLVASKKGYGCKPARETIKHYTQIQIKVKEQLVLRKDMDVNEHERLPNVTLIHKLK